MRRFHLIELHEQPWMPALWRTMFQEGLGRSLEITGAYRGFAAPFERFLRRTGAPAVLDLCSGSAEPVIQLREALEEGAPRPAVVLSDLYPDVEEFQRVRRSHPGIVDYYPQPVDALHPPADAPGVWTMFRTLHHFKPEQVRAFLTAAAERADGVAVFEATQRVWASLLLALAIPFFAAFIFAFLLRPFRWRYLLWGVLIPVVPLISFFDTVVSVLRTYSAEELEGFTRAVDVPGFEWEVGSVPVLGFNLQANYLFGWRCRQGQSVAKSENG